VLSRIWLGFFFASGLAALWQWLGRGDAGVFARITQSLYDMAGLAVEISIGLIGLLCLWMGLFRIAERSGFVSVLARLLTPLFRRLMPEVPPGHPALGSVTMNLAANVLGLDNAATPMGLQAMRDLQRLNPDPKTATDAQILFLVLNTSSVTLIPVTVFLFRAQQGSSDPTAVFLPILIATSASTVAGLLAVGWAQRLRLWDPVVLAYFMVFAALAAALGTWLGGLPPEDLAARSSLLGNLLVFAAVLGFLAAGAWRGLDTYTEFVSGAKQGLATAVRLVPYLVAMLAAIGALRASGALDAVVEGMAGLLAWVGVDTGFVAALPTGLMKPLSGSGARAMLLETMHTQGVDSFPATVAAIMQGSTETTFYVLAVYFGAVGIRNSRHAVTCGLIADLAGLVTAVLAGYWFFAP